MPRSQFVTVGKIGPKWLGYSCAMPYTLAYVHAYVHYNCNCFISWPGSYRVPSDVIMTNCSHRLPIWMRYESTPIKNGAFRYSYRDFWGQVAIYWYFITLMIVKLNRPSLLLATERGSGILLIACSAWFNIYTTIHLVGWTCIYNLSREHDEITPRKCFPHYNSFCRKTNSHQQCKRLVKLPRHMSDIIVTNLMASSHISFPATRFKLHWDLQKHIWEVFPYFTLLCWICINELNNTQKQYITPV